MKSVVKCLTNIVIKKSTFIWRLLVFETPVRKQMSVLKFSKMWFLL